MPKKWCDWTATGIFNLKQMSSFANNFQKVGDCYWPKDFNVRKQYGEVSVELQSTKSLDGNISSTFTVSKVRN